MAVSLDLLMNAVISGLLLGGFYAAVSVGVAISFGLLDVVNIAHPAFILLGSYVAFIGNTVFGVDPILYRGNTELVQAGSKGNRKAVRPEISDCRSLPKVERCPQ